MSKKYYPGIANEIRKDIEGLETMKGVCATLVVDSEQLEYAIEKTIKMLRKDLEEVEQHLLEIRSTP